MKRIMVAIGFATLLAPAQARADLIFYFDKNNLPGNPAENLDVVKDSTNPVTGTTNNTGTAFQISGSEALTAKGNGQGPVEGTGNFEWGLVQPTNPLVFFTEFEANFKLDEDGWVRVQVTENDNVVSNGWFFGDGDGENRFNIVAINDQLMRSVQIATVSGENSSSFIENIADLRQIRLSPCAGSGDFGSADSEDELEACTGGDDGSDGGTIVPEPGSMLLLGSGLCAAAVGLRRRLRK